MKVATILFTYNRPEHTQRVIESLSHNTVLPEKIYIFHDGLKNGHDENKWKKVKEIIYSIDFCETEIIESSDNKGLAKSIIWGIKQIFNDYDAVIVLEDDCYAAPDFISFMYQAFDKYKEYKQVYSISGYAWPQNFERNEYDAYFSGRFSSWGWGTWKDRWEEYNQDSNYVERLKSKRESSIDLATWGKDLERMLQNTLQGKCDSWAVYWALHIIEKRGRCLTPIESLIANIGLDNSGVNCNKTDYFDVKLDMKKNQVFKLPDNDIIEEKIKEFYINYIGGTTILNNKNNKKHVWIYGQGGWFSKNENIINGKFYIEGFIDKIKKGYYAGRQIKSVDELDKEKEYIIIIMLEDKQQCMLVKDELNKKYEKAFVLCWYEIL